MKVSLCACVCVHVCVHVSAVTPPPWRVTMVNRTNPADRIMATKLSIHRNNAPPLTPLIRRPPPRPPSPNPHPLLPASLCKKKLRASCENYRKC